VSDELEILPSGGLVRCDGFLLSLDQLDSCFVDCAKQEVPGKSIDHIDPTLQVCIDDEPRSDAQHLRCGLASSCLVHVAVTILVRREVK
jgi:hypothetical protein